MPSTLREIQKPGLPHCSRRFLSYTTKGSRAQAVVEEVDAVDPTLELPFHPLFRECSTVTDSHSISDFGWQDGVFSVSESNVSAVTKYIACREKHPRKHSFQDASASRSSRRTGLWWTRNKFGVSSLALGVLERVFPGRSNLSSVARLGGRGCPPLHGSCDAESQNPHRCRATYNESVQSWSRFPRPDWDLTVRASSCCRNRGWGDSKAVL
jgi:hypothetical protein